MPELIATRKDIKRISKVFLSLAHLIESNPSNPVPEDIESLVLGLQVAHQRFEEGINKYMHQADSRALSEVQTMKTIIRKSPYYLSVQDEEGKLPIHAAALSDPATSSTFVPLLAKAGMRHGIGGEEGRGGLLVTDGFVQCPIQIITANGHLKTMRALRYSIEPKLLKREDVTNYGLLHLASFSGNLDLIKMLVGINPQGLYDECSKGSLPIHYTKSLSVKKLLISSAIKHDPNHKSVGGLFATNSMGVTPINHIIDKIS